jgi:GT2 family glycosyltransferase
MAVVVLSHGPRATLCDAVRSLLRQDVETEIVVVHSGGGDVRGLLRDAALDVRVVQSRERLFAGAARNLGIAETGAPFIAFLADDCVAEQGWVRNRLQAHRAGAAAVASALVCHQPTNPIALAAHLSLYFRRMPRAVPSLALKYGVSYARQVFDRHGGFRADFESGEDTEFNKRLVGADAPIWAPEVLTVHRGPDTLGSFFRGQFLRGRRMAKAWRALGILDSMTVVRDALARTRPIVRETWRVVEPRHRGAALLCIPLIVLGNLVYAWGAWRGEGRGA